MPSIMTWNAFSASESAADFAMNQTQAHNIDVERVSCHSKRNVSCKPALGAFGMYECMIDITRSCSTLCNVCSSFGGKPGD